MRSFRIRSASSPLRGVVFLPSDKSITHRAIILSAICQGKTRIKNFAFNNDCLSTLNVFKQLGVRIKFKPKELVISGVGLKGLHRSPQPLSIGESGTTLRVLLGVLAGQPFTATLVAGKSLSRRPMHRVTAPLRIMGAKISAKRKTCLPAGREQAAKVEEYPPLTIRGGQLKPITYKMPIASAQVKSALLLAGLYSKGKTRIIEPIKTRNHTEKMLKLFRANIKVKGKTISIKGGKELVSPSVLYIPGDISSATFFMVAAMLVPGSYLAIKSVGLNPTRWGAIRVLKRMGAHIKLLPHQQTGKLKTSEPVGDIIVKSSNLKGTRVKKEEIPSLIDEVPILMVAACYAKGKTIFEGVEELRVKETDRINSMMGNLKKMGADIQLRQRNYNLSIIITGTKQLEGTEVSSFNDHRTAMSMVIAGLKAKGETLIDEVRCINKSFPNFLKVLQSLL